MLGFFALVQVWMIFQLKFIIRGLNFSLCGGVRHIQDIIKWSLACVASVSNRVIARKLERKQKKGRSPPPPPSFMFFCSCPSFLDESREETLATQAKWSPFGKCAAVKTSCSDGFHRTKWREEREYMTSDVLCLIYCIFCPARAALQSIVSVKFVGNMDKILEK